MHNRNFGATGRSVSEVGMGCWQFGGDWGEVSDDDALATLRAAVDAGVTFFDTADVYGGGRSEELIGRFLRGAGAAAGELFVATKLGRYFEPGGEANLTPVNLRAHTDASLRRLGVPSLDLTQLHCIDPDALRRGDVFDTLRALKSEGKIKAFGASVETMDDALVCLEQEGLTALQIIFNIFRQKPITALFDQAKAKNVALIVRLPLASGLLAGKMRHGQEFAPQDHRTYNRDGQAFNVGETFAGLPFDRGVDLAEQVKSILPLAAGATMAQESLRWCLDHDAVTVVIPGAKSPDMARANAAASDLAPLASDVRSRLAGLYEDEVKESIRGPY